MTKPAATMKQKAKARSSRSRKPGRRVVAASAKNSAEKTGPQRDPVTGRLSGGNPGNSGGKPGRSGRPPKKFIELSKEIVESVEFQEVMWNAATDPSHDHHRFYAEKAMAYAEGQPRQSVQHGADDRFGKLLESLVGASQE